MTAKAIAFANSTDAGEVTFMEYLAGVLRKPVPYSATHTAHVHGCDMDEAFPILNLRTTKALKKQTPN